MESARSHAADFMEFLLLEIIRHNLSLGLSKVETLPTNENAQDG